MAISTSSLPCSSTPPSCCRARQQQHSHCADGMAGQVARQRSKHRPHAPAFRFGAADAAMRRRPCLPKSKAFCSATQGVSRVRPAGTHLRTARHDAVIMVMIYCIGAGDQPEVREVRQALDCRAQQGLVGRLAAHLRVGAHAQPSTWVNADSSCQPEPGHAGTSCLLDASMQAALCNMQSTHAGACVHMHGSCLSCMHLLMA